MSFPTIALISDYGYQDGYAGIVKGSIFQHIQSADKLSSQNPSPPIIDITHTIEPHNIKQGAWVLNNCYKNFPKFTIFVAIVDPKMGHSDSRPILLYNTKTKHYFIAPDNGLLTPVIQNDGETLKAYSLENDDLFMKVDGKVTHSFHGRDIYGSVAGHLANALLEYMGEEFAHKAGKPLELESIHTLNWPQPTKDKNFITAEIVHIDHFGNLMTTIPADWLAPNQKIEILVNSKKWLGNHLASYMSGDNEDQVFVVTSSSGNLEVAKFGADASKFLNASVGDEISLHLL